MGRTPFVIPFLPSVGGPSSLSPHSGGSHQLWAFQDVLHGDQVLMGKKAGVPISAARKQEMLTPGRDSPCAGLYTSLKMPAGSRRQMPASELPVALFKIQT